MEIKKILFLIANYLKKLKYIERKRDIYNLSDKEILDLLKNIHETEIEKLKNEKKIEKYEIEDIKNLIEFRKKEYEKFKKIHPPSVVTNECEDLVFNFIFYFFKFLNNFFLS
jgi:methyl coenzyme M reductase gamma subunit